MDVGIPREIREFEHRVGLAPGGVHVLVRRGSRVFVETNAGAAAGFSDEDYKRVGAEIVYTTEEAYQRPDIILKVGRPQPKEYDLLGTGKILGCFLHLAVAPSSLVDVLLEKQITTLAYELLEDEHGHRTIAGPVSLICGRMCCQVASRHMENTMGGKGILLSGVPGVPAADVLIIGAGQVGRSAAEMFKGIGASVVVMDIDFEALQELEQYLGGSGLQTMVATKFNIQRVLKYADVVVCAVSVPGERSPIVITREMLSVMQHKALVIDVAIDQGGCVETSRPTTLGTPTFVEGSIIHYCVPNMSSNVARTASHLITNALTGMVRGFAEKGFVPTIKAHPGIRDGVVTHQGHLVNEAVAKSLKREHQGLEALGV